MEETKKKHPGWGGARPGSGPKRKLDAKGDCRRKHSVYVTPTELVIVRDFIKQYREAVDAGKNSLLYQFPDGVADLKQNRN